MRELCPHMNDEMIANRNRGKTCGKRLIKLRKQLLITKKLLLILILEPILHPQSSSLSTRTVLITLLLSAATQLVSLAGQGRIKPEKFEMCCSQACKIIRT